MKRNRPKLFLLIAYFLLFVPSLVFAQNCVPTGLNNTTINSSCNQACRDLVFQVPDIRSTSDYTVISIPYNPYPYVTAGGTVDLSLYDDDAYSAVFNLPFPFCFFDDVYTQAVVGSNGLVTFDVSNAGCTTAGWDISNPIPFSGATQCSPSAGTNYYPKASIMGAFMDLDARINIVPPPAPPYLPTSSPADRKIEWRVEGTAPCRRFVVSYYHIGVYEGTTCGNTTPTTFQIVMTESTGVIDIYFENKTCPANSSADGARAILGIQDITRTKAVAAPGKNATSWTASNEGYRFVPTGGTSRFVSSELLAMNLSHVAFATTSNTTPGLLNLDFPNICSANPSTQYIVKTVFSACDNPATQLISMDTVTVAVSSAFNAIATSTNTSCGLPSGSITVTVPAGMGTAPYSFQLDGGAIQIGASPYTFNNVTAGPHTILVSDASGGCSSPVNITVGQTNSLTATTTQTATSCPGVNNGTVSVVPNNGTGPYTFTLNPGGIAQSGNTTTYTGLAPGFYTIDVVDANGCATSTPISFNIATGSGLLSSQGVVSTSCSGANNGSITINTMNGTVPFQFSLNGGPPQASNTFTNLAAGSYTISYSDANGCTSGNIPVTIPAGPVLTTSVTHTDVLCNSGSTGTITVAQPLIGTAPYEYSLDGIIWQSSNTFSGLTANTYTVYYRENDGCQNSQTLTISQPNSIVATLNTTSVICNGQNNGMIVVNVSGGTAPYQYSLDGGAYQSGNTFNVPPGNHVITILDNNGCTFSPSGVTITQPMPLTISTTTQNATCNGGSNGLITITAGGGNTSYQYSIDGITFQPSNIFNVVPGNYTITVKDNLGCTITGNATVGLTTDITMTPQIDQTTCEGTSAQLQFTSNATQYSWTPTNGLNNPAIANPLANPTTTTQYIVTGTLGLCSVNDTVVVNVNTAPVPDAGPDGDICYGQSYQLQASGGVSYSWAPSSYLSNTSVPNPMVATPKNTITYGLSVTDAIGCQSVIADSVTVNVTPPIHVSTFPKDTIVYSGDQFQVIATSAGNIYSWSPSIGLSNPNIPDPIVTAGFIGDEITYTVTASTVAGCAGDGSVKIKVYKGPDIYVPTAFTPNNDGKNDKFMPVPIGIKKLNYFKVFNRWGQMIFSTVTLNDGWDGKIAGKEQVTGVYIWMIQGITEDDRVISKKGTVTLIR